MTEFSGILRPCDPERDIAAIVEIENAAWTHAGFRFQATDEALLRDRWERVSAFVPERDCVVVERGDGVAAYGAVLCATDGDGRRIVTLQGGVRPEARHGGLGAVVLRWQTRRAWDMTKQPRRLEMTVLDGQDGHAALATAFGFAPVQRIVQMVCDLTMPIDATPLPEGLIVRAPEREEIRRVLEARNEAFRGTRGHVDATEDDYRGMESDPEAQPEGWHVAWEARTGEPVGAAQPGIYVADNARFGLRRGWVYWLWVKQEWRRRGAARALLGRACAALRAQGMDEATLFADAENESGATTLYERAGFRPVGGWAVYRRESDDDAEHQAA